jgi:hypothetical protein
LPVTAIFYDDLQVFSSGGVARTFGIIKADTSFGSLGTPRSTSLAEYRTSVPLPAIAGRLYRKYGWYSSTSFFSVTTLKDVDRLEIWPKGNRLMGLYITHVDGVAEVLGQWDPSEIDSTVMVYEQNRGVLRDLTFIFSEGHVREIRIGLEDSPLFNLADNGSQSPEPIFYHIELEKVSLKYI